MASSTEIQNIINDYLENIYSNKLGNKEWNTFLGIYSLSKFNQQAINTYYKAIINDKIGASNRR